MATETAFTMDTSAIKVGPGVTGEIGGDLRGLGCARVLIVTDSRMADLSPVAVVAGSLRDAGIAATVYDRVRVEPTDGSFKDAIDFAIEGHFDGFVAVGGGSSIDTAKAANLYSTYPDDFLTYVNPPIGEGTPVPGPLKPLIAVPTTAGTGSETTGVAIFDYLAMRAKTGIAHRALRPTMGIVDPDNTRDMPPLVAAASALDVLSHALESLTALPYGERPAPESPELRPAYQGSNPISDIWSARAIELVAGNLVHAVAHPEDDEARMNMLIAATFAGIGFGNAGVHLPHGMSYPVSGMVRDYQPEGYPDDHPIVPHGISVILNAPAVFRFTASADPERHLRAARLLGADTAGAADADAGDVLANTVIDLMRATGMPNGLAAIGFTDADVDALAAGTLPQHRVTKLSPQPADEDDLRGLFRDAMSYW
jgi:hydroxyacid-oxoacid transhydrogenase